MISNLINKMLSKLFPYKGQPWKHLSEANNQKYRFSRSISVVTGYAKKPEHLLDKGVSKQ
jgi:hypothetical protein